MKSFYVIAGVGLEFKTTGENFLPHFLERKIMTPEQKKLAVERLRIAQEKRLRDNPPRYDWVHKSVKKLPADNLFSFKNIRQWIKTQKECLAKARANVAKKQDGAIAEVADISGYIRNMEYYLRYGIWIDMQFGEHREYWIQTKTVAKAGNKNDN